MTHPTGIMYSCKLGVFRIGAAYLLENRLNPDNIEDNQPLYVALTPIKILTTPGFNYLSGQFLSQPGGINCQ